MEYETLKNIHRATAALSFAGFFIRGAAVFTGAHWVYGRLAKTLPHVVDTLLLASRLGLAWWLQLSPGTAPWLVAKLAGVVVYIVLGIVALKPGRPMAVRFAAWIGALVTFGYIAGVAITKDPGWPVFMAGRLLR
jgi:uncharacterized membrane protein SirB2